MSPLPGVRKGNTWEQVAADYLGTERRHLRGNLDRGDLVHPHWTCEAKCPGRGKPLNLSAAMTEARREAANNGQDRWCVIARRTGYPIDEAFWVTPLFIARRDVPDLDLRTVR